MEVKMAKLRGSGIAAVNYPTGMNLGGDPTQALIHATTTGTFVISLASSDLGQGLKTVIAQSERLDLLQKSLDDNFILLTLRLGLRRPFDPFGSRDERHDGDHDRHEGNAGRAPHQPSPPGLPGVGGTESDSGSAQSLS